MMIRVCRLGLSPALIAAGLGACSAHPTPPSGRWQGVYEDTGLMVVARLEIDQGGHVRVSAPNAIGDFAGMPEQDRAQFRARLATGLARSWSVVGFVPL